MITNVYIDGFNLYYRALTRESQLHRVDASFPIVVGFLYHPYLFGGRVETVL